MAANRRGNVLAILALAVSVMALVIFRRLEQAVWPPERSASTGGEQR